MTKTPSTTKFPGLPEEMCQRLRTHSLFWDLSRSSLSGTFMLCGSSRRFIRLPCMHEACSSAQILKALVGPSIHLDPVF